MSSQNETNWLLLDFSDGTNYRDGDVFMIRNGKEELIGPGKILSEITFRNKGTCLPEANISRKSILDLLDGSAYDNIFSYLPYIENGKLVVVNPVGEKRAMSSKLNYSDSTQAGSSAWPELICIEEKVLRVITLLKDMGSDRNMQLFSNWTYDDGQVMPSYIDFEPRA